MDNNNLDSTENYRSILKDTIKNLLDVKHKIFIDIVNLGMSNEFKEINEVFEVGDTFHFEPEHFENSNDINVEKMMALYKHISDTAESIANINAIEEDEETVDGKEESDETVSDLSNDSIEVLDHQQKIIYDLVNQILWAVWDPYGINENEGSEIAYENTSRKLYELKNAGGDLDEMAMLLYAEEEKGFGERASYSNCEKVAAIIHAL